MEILRLMLDFDLWEKLKGRFLAVKCIFLVCTAVQKHNRVPVETEFFQVELSSANLEGTFFCSAEVKISIDEKCKFEAGNLVHRDRNIFVQINLQMKKSRLNILMHKVKLRKAKMM